AQTVRVAGPPVARARPVATACLGPAGGGRTDVLGCFSLFFPRQERGFRAIGNPDRGKADAADVDGSGTAALPRAASGPSGATQGNSGKSGGRQGQSRSSPHRQLHRAVSTLYRGRTRQSPPPADHPWGRLSIRGRPGLGQASRCFAA